MRVTVRAASDYAALCLHGLAHLPLVGPERLQDLRYQAHAKRTLPEGAVEPLVTDAPAIAAALHGVPGAALAAQWLPLLHVSIEAFLASASHELSQVEHAHPRALAALRDHACDGLEWLRTDLLLVAEAFASGATNVEDEARQIEERAADLEHLGLPERFEIAPSLGPRGRAYPEVIIVGAPQSWWCVDEVDRAIPLVLAVHEHAVRAAASDHVTSEWSALRSVAHTLRDSPLAEAHQRWLAGLDLGDLLDVLERARVVSSIDGVALRTHADERADRLASLHHR